MRCIRLLFASTLALGCAHPSPTSVTHAPPASPSAKAQTSESRVPAAPFAPLVADPVRKAKLVAVLPEVDRLLEKEMKERGVTGAAIGIVLEGELVHLRGFGVRDLESKEPVDTNTLFRLGSVSKTITALAVMRLRDQGKLTLDEPASTYLPALRSLPLPTRDSPAITTAHLLTMTSGLGYDDLWGAVTFGYSNAELEGLLARGVSFGGAPGERYRYSNLGFALLGKLVERTSGVPFETYVEREVFAPLGMKSSGYVTRPIPTGKMAVGYYREGEGESARHIAEPVGSDGVFAPAGGAYTSIHDLARYAAFHIAAYPPRDDVETGAVRRSTLREMHTGRAWARWHEDYPVLKLEPDGSPTLSAASYGYGWMQNTSCRAEAMVQHGGFEPGYFAAVRLLPRQRIAVVTLSASANLVQLQTFDRLAALLDEGGVFQPAPPPAAPALLRARDTVLHLLTRWDPALVARTFHPLTQRFSFVRNFRPDMERMTREHGACRPDGDVTPLSRAHGRFRVACERGSIEFLAYLTPETKPVIQMIEWRRELPATAAERANAEKLLAVVHGNKNAGAGIFASQASRVELERLRASFNRCALQSVHRDGNGSVTARLRCDEAQRELGFRLDAKGSLVSEVSVTTPRASGAVCVY
jgi:CubicO group peptidase (beta-lactamase class C family)